MRSRKSLARLSARQRWLWKNRSAFGAREGDGPPRLLVDVSTIIRHDAQTGIQRVVRSVWSELRRRSGENFEVLPVFATDAHGYCPASADFLTGNNGASCLESARVRQGDKFLGLDLSAHLLPKYRRQLRAWRAQGASIHLLVYDLLPLLGPEWFNDSTVRHFRNWYSVLEKDADQAICISDEVAGELRRRLRQTGQKGPQITRMQLGADIAASLPSAGIGAELSRLLERIRFRPAVLMVGTVEPRKSYDAALRAFEHVWRTRPDEAPDLVIVGKSGWKTSGLQAELRSHPQRGRRLHWLTDVSDEGLCRLYDSCCGLLMASRAEGFGLPLVEAAMARRYVLARELPVFREQRLPNALFFGDESPEPLGERVMELATLSQSGAAPVAPLLTWSECVEGLLRGIGFETKQAHEGEGRLRKAS